MAESSVPYDRPLPEIPGRRAWEPPGSYLVKDDAAAAGWRVEESGRRPSDLPLVPKIREEVNRWREDGYPGASGVTRELFRHWFDDEHDVPGLDGPFRFHFGQREAMETLAWLVEVVREPDTALLIERCWTAAPGELGADAPVFSTTIGGARRVRWRLPRVGEKTQELPPDGLRRHAFRMATGAGKTWLMAMVVVWAHFHRRFVPESPLSANFLIVAPNVIVYERLRQDFAGNAIFHRLPLIPPAWKGDFDQRVILRGDVAEPADFGNLFLTNIQQLYDRSQVWKPRNPTDALLGEQSPSTPPARSMLARVAALPDLIVMNDEAHHVHDEELAWSQALLGLHESLPGGLAAWLDFSATPKHQGGLFFPWIVCDYPLQQAVEDRIVKAPVIVTNEDDAGRPLRDPEGVRGADAAEKYGYWIRAAVQCLKRHETAYRPLDVQPILFVMTEKIPHAKNVARYLAETPSFGFRAEEILVIHTDAKGDVKQKDLDALRRAAREVDSPESGVRVIVSVMMLREGWDVKNVSVVLGLRPFSAKAEILPEQVIGRGLRLMAGVTPDRTQTLEVLGTTRLLETLRRQLEMEGVSVSVQKSPPPAPVVIEPVRERLEYDVALPDVGRRLEQVFAEAGAVEVGSLEQLTSDEHLPEQLRSRLYMEFAMTESEIHQEEAVLGELRSADSILGDIAATVGRKIGLPLHFPPLYSLVRDYAAKRCFGGPVDLEERRVLGYLGRPEVREAIVRLLARAVGERVAVERPAEREPEYLQLSGTRPFHWRRNLPPPALRKTVFNYVATWNDFERRFAEFLDRAPDVLRFAALAATEQGTNGVQFRVDYVKPNGAVGFYYPDWVVVQRDEYGETSWIVETKGFAYPGTREKDQAIRDWCRRVEKVTDQKWWFVRINQDDFDVVEQRVETFGHLFGAVLARGFEKVRRSIRNPLTIEEIKEYINEGRE